VCVKLSGVTRARDRINGWVIWSLGSRPFLVVAVGDGAIIGIEQIGQRLVPQFVPAFRDKMWQPINEGGGELLWKTSSRGDGMRTRSRPRSDDEKGGFGS
jgi:hypothetical protein